MKRKNLFRFWLFNTEDGTPPSTPDISVSEGEAQGVGAEISMENASPKPDTKIDWNSVIPEDLRGKDYFQNVLKAENPGAELVKQFDNAQQLIGKKSPAIPGDDATDEDWNKFFETTRPKSPEEYKLQDLNLGEDKKEIAEFISKNRDPEFVKGINEAAYKHGLTKKQFEGFAADYEKLQAPYVEQQYKAQRDMDTHFESIAKETFGGDKDKTLEFGRKFIKEYASEKTREYATSLPNEALIIIADMAAKVHAKYEKGDSFNAPSGGGNDGKSIEGLRSEMHKLMTEEGYQNSFAPGSAEVRDRVKQISAQIAQMSKK